MPVYADAETSHRVVRVQIDRAFNVRQCLSCNPTCEYTNTWPHRGVDRVLRDERPAIAYKMNERSECLVRDDDAFPRLQAPERALANI
jgi:hypothetical protein